MTQCLIKSLNDNPCTPICSSLFPGAPTPFHRDRGAFNYSEAHKSSHSCIIKSGSPSVSRLVKCLSKENKRWEGERAAPIYRYI